MLQSFALRTLNAIIIKLR